jgi:UDP-N-acetylmuramoylalanine--D-glutamate ligase
MLKKKHAYIAGNSVTHPLLGVLEKINKSNRGVVVNEIPSFHLELFYNTKYAPHVAIITNVYQDHLNRHGTIENYAQTKGFIFQGQSKNDILILNYDNVWTKKFLKQKPKSKIYVVSLKPLPKNREGVYVKNNHIVFQHNRIQESVCNIEAFEEKWGSHNIYNMLMSALASHMEGISWKEIEKKIKNLPSIKFRQETIIKKKNLEVINDTTATSPEGGIASVKRFGGFECVLIAGGTDGNLDYDMWGREVIAEDFFSEFQKHGLFNKELGKKYRKEILAMGGSYDEEVLVKNFLGRPVSNEPFLKHIGLE